MPNLPNFDECCGCAVCVDVCPRNAISLSENRDYYYMPSVDSGKCVECGLCTKVCHIIHQEEVKRNSIGTPFAAWSTNKDLIENSASGGIFAQIALDFLHNDGHIVIGAMLDSDSVVRHVEISNVDDLHKIQNSKYQQSNTVGIYRLVKRRLKEGRFVLFSGVPCQVAGLYSYLKYNKSWLCRLYTTEVICHGVPTNYLHRVGLKIEHASRILKYRTKSEGWLRGNRLVYEYADKTIKEKQSRREDFLFRSYLSFSFSRKNCYACKYARIERVADLTLGDFWGVNTNKIYNYNGVSLVTVNSEKGEFLFKKNSHINSIQISWKDCLPYNQNLYMPTNKYIYIGSGYVHIFKKLPLIIQKFIFQNGFSGRVLNKAYLTTFSLIYKYSSYKKEKLMISECRKTLNKVQI